MGTKMESVWQVILYGYHSPVMEIIHVQRLPANLLAGVVCAEINKIDYFGRP